MLIAKRLTLENVSNHLTTGFGNTAIGFNALFSNTTGGFPVI
jgi:hypothetical protein